jgi:hypothetical protein
MSRVSYKIPLASNPDMTCQNNFWERRKQGAEIL